MTAQPSRSERRRGESAGRRDAQAPPVPPAPVHDLRDLTGARAREAFDSLGAGVAVTDTAGVVLAVNAAACEMVRAPREALVGRLLKDAVPTAGTDARHPFDRVVASLRRRGGGAVHEALVRRADGTSFWARCTVALARAGGREVVVVQAVDDDEEHRALAERVHRADHDELTGLRNRTALLDELDRRLQLPGPPLAVMVCDLDRFGVLNADLGHVGADEVLVAAARRLLGAVRGGDVVARLGSDEFAVVVEASTAALPAAEVEGAALETARRLASALAEPLRAGGREVRCGAGVGVALAVRDGVGDDVRDDVSDGVGDGVRAPDALSLLRDADTALRTAKGRGPGQVRLFRPVMRERLLARLRVEDELRAALEGGRLQVHYQPVVRLADGERVGFEALVRWPHPRRGLLEPEEFLPVAEEAGLAVAVDALVLERALDLLQRRPGVRVSVNTGARRLDGTFAEEVARGLRRRGLAPGRLVVELLEHSLLAGDPTTALELQRLSAAGVPLAVDDFGTGYSALSYLRRLPVSVLKLDRSFLADVPGDPAAERVTAAVLGLAHGLGLQAVAEGVESAEQAEHLRAQGWDLAQGWFFGRAAPEADWYPGR
ncbi:putative bifunctional diguanylate cyclase/phosphodiesterase [Kineococcus gypseus]|uniref:putative bifunctional diguanylate cyclase/phosphodiesterase n=1 Tax=Kineococcus gypseus TaxID=1637102 RepID=UPI003D7E1611